MRVGWAAGARTHPGAWARRGWDGAHGGGVLEGGLLAAARLAGRCGMLTGMLAGAGRGADQGAAGVLRGGGLSPAAGRLLRGCGA